MKLYKNFLIILGTPILFAYLKFRLKRQVDKVLKSRETKNISGGDESVDWVSLIKKYEKNLPYILAVFGAVSAGTVLVFGEQITENLLTILPGTLYSNYSGSNNGYFAVLERYQTVLKIKEAATLIETFDLESGLSLSEKMDAYKLIIMDILTFDSKRKLFFVLVSFVSLLGYLFTANILLFGQFIGALIVLIKEGKISKSVARLLIQMLRVKKLPVPDELEELLK